MAKGHWIGRVDVDDLEHYQDYVKANAPAFEAYDARFMIPGGQFKTVEGQSRARNVVIEFPSYQAAVDCYNSDVYQSAKSFRDPVSVADLIIIEGHDG